MEDEERQKKLEAGKAKLAEYRQRKAHADSQKKQKKKKKKKTGDDLEGDSQERGEADPDQSVDTEEVSSGGQDGMKEGARDPPTTEFTFAKTLRSGESVKHDQTYTIEPESEVSTTAEDYSSEEEVEVQEDKMQVMEDVKTQTEEELNRELEEIRASFGTDEVQQLQDFEAALKQRDGIITQLTANLQQAREEKDEIMKEFLKLTEQSQKLQIQFQQLQAGETLRNTSHSSTAADLLQARQQLVQYQQQLEEVNVEVREHQERSSEQLQHISQLQHQLNEMEMSGRRSEETFMQTINKKELLITDMEKVISSRDQMLVELRTSQESFAQTLEEKSLVISEQTAIITQHERSLASLREELVNVGRTDENVIQQSDEKDLIIAEQKRIISEQECSVSQLKEDSESSEKCLRDIQRQMAAGESELEKCQSELKNTKSELDSCRAELDDLKEELVKEKAEFESCQSELSTSKQKERMSSNEIMQLMGTVEELQRRCHQGSVTESDTVQQMQDENARKLELLRAELDEVYGQQIVQMKQEINLQHSEKVEKMTQQHSTELELLKVQLSQSSSDSSAQMESLNAKIKVLQETLEQTQATHDQSKLELNHIAREKLDLQVKIEDLLKDLHSAHEKVELVSHHLKSQESQQEEVQSLQEMIDSLKSQLAAAQEAAQETEVKHESEVTNYKIKLEMLEREKDAVLDRMAESQEAELERLRTQLLFSHEEELTYLREDLQRENFMNTENLLNEAAIKHQKVLDELRLNYEEELTLSRLEKENFAKERDELRHQILGLKEDLNLALQTSKADELVEQLQELQVELEELRKEGEERQRLENEIQTLLNRTDVLEKEAKDKEESWELEKKTLTESHDTLKEDFTAKCKEINFLTLEKNQIQHEVDALKEKIQNQKTTFSFAEKNFEVNYQELKEEYMCLVKAKTHLEEKTLRETLEFETKITRLESEIGKLESRRDVRMEETHTVYVEKDTTELMEKLKVTICEKETITDRLSEVNEKLLSTQNKVEQLEEELTKVRRENTEVMTKNKRLEKVLEENQEQMRKQKEEQASDDSQTQSLREEIKALQSLLRAAEAERDEIRQTLDLQQLSQPPSAATVQCSGEGPVEGRSLSQRPTTASQHNKRKKRQKTRQEHKPSISLPGSRGDTQREEEEEAAAAAASIEEKRRATSAAAQKKQNPQMKSQVVSRSQQRARTQGSSKGHRVDGENTSKQVNRDEMDDCHTDPAVCQRAEEGEGTTEHGECRLQMEAQRLSLSQLHAAQLELLQEEADALTHTAEPKMQSQKVHSDPDEPINLLHAVSEECRKIILSYQKMFGEEFLENVSVSEQVPSEVRPQTSESTATVLETKELYQRLQQMRERMEREHERLSQLQAELRAEGNKIMEMQKAYDELKSSSEKEICDLRVQVADFTSSPSKGPEEPVDTPPTSTTEELQRLQAEAQKKHLQQEQSHTQEMERLRAHYQQEATEAEERYATELFMLQQRLQEVTGTQTLPSLSTMSESASEKMDEHSAKDLSEEELSGGDVVLGWSLTSPGLSVQLQTLRKALYNKYVQEVATLKEQHSVELRRLREEREREERRREECQERRAEKEQGLDSEECRAAEEDVLEEKRYWERVEEEVAKAIVQISVEFAQQTEMARINKHACQASTSMQTQSCEEEMEEQESEEQTPRDSFSPGAWLEEMEREKMEKELEERNAEIQRLKEELQRAAGAAEKVWSHTLKKQTHDEGEVEEEEDPGGLEIKESYAQTLSSPSQDITESSPSDVERDLLRKANEKLSQVLVDVLKTTAAAEETIGLHMQNLSDASVEQQQVDEPQVTSQTATLQTVNTQTFRASAAGHTAEGSQGTKIGAEDLSPWSRETETDKGLKASQQMVESLLLGAETQLENEEFLMGIGGRLQSALERMLMAINDTTNQLEHARLTQTELMRESFRHNQEINELLQKQEELQERLTEEARAREDLALELHRAEGLIDGYTGERAALEEQLRQKEELQMSLEQELQVTSSRLQELEQDRLQMQEERELLSRQQDAMREHAGSRELRLVEAAMVAAPEADLLEETEKLMKEKVEVQRQAEKENSDLLKQVKLLEAELEEQVNRVIELEQARRTENGDLQQQIQALEKQLDKNRKFLDEQAVDREHERDFFQQEIQKLEKQLKNPQKVQTGSEQRNQEVDQLTSQLKEKADWCSELLLSSEQLHRDLKERDEEIDKLESRIRELEQALLASAESLEKAEQKKQHASITESRQSALEAQLQTEREALERKEKEICNLEEQLEQFREELENKSEEVQQLHMQLEIQRKEISSQQEYLETRDSMLQVMEEKDREIALLNEQISKLRHTETASSNKELDGKDDLLKDLESQVECLQSEQEHLKRNHEEELDQLNAVIDKLQQELVNIEQNRVAEEDEDFVVEEERGPRQEEYDELKQKLDLLTTELDMLRTEHSKLLETYLCLKETADDSGDGEKVCGLKEELQSVLREKTAGLVVMQAQVQALEQSATSRVEEFRLRIQELEDLVNEKDSELSRCRLLVEQTQSYGDGLQQKVSDLEYNLSEKMVTALVSQATLEALQQQENLPASTEDQDVQEHKESIMKSNVELQSQDFGDFGIPRIDFRGLGQIRQAPTEKVVHLTQTLRDLEAGLSGMQKDQEIQKQLLSSSEEEVVEYERRLAACMDLLSQMKPGTQLETWYSVESSSADDQHTVSELLQELDQVKDEASAAKEQLHSYKESCSRLQEELQEKKVTIQNLEGQLQQVATGGSEEVQLQQELVDARDEATATKEELNSCKESLEKLQELLQEREMTIAHLKGELFQVKSLDGAVSTELLQELQEVRDSWASTKEELNRHRQQNEKLQEELQGQVASLSKFKEEQLQLMKEMDATREELSGYKMQNEKLQGELKFHESSFSKLEEEPQQLIKEFETAKQELSRYKQQTETLQQQLEVQDLSSFKLKEELHLLMKDMETSKEELRHCRQQNEKLEEELQLQKLSFSKAEEEQQRLMKVVVDSNKGVVKSSKQQSEEVQAELEVLQVEPQHLIQEMESADEVTGSKQQHEKLQYELQARDISISKLQQELQQLVKEMDITKEELTSYKQQNEKLQEELQVQVVSMSELSEGNQELVEEMDTTKKELDSYRQQKEKLQEELHNREISISKLKEELQQLEQEMETTKEELTSYRTQNKKPQVEQQVQESSVPELKVEPEQMIKEVQTAMEVSSSNQQNKKPQEDLRIQDVRNSELSQDNQHLLKELDTTNEELTRYRAQNEELQKELEERELCISKLKEELQQLEKEMATTNEELSSLRKQNEKPQEELQVQQLKVEAGPKKEIDPVKDVSSCNQQNEKLQEELQVQEVLISNLNHEHQHLTKQLDTTNEELTRYRTQNKELQDELQTRETSISKLEEEHERLMKELDTTKEELSSYRQQNEKLHGELQVQELSIPKFKEDPQQLLTEVDTANEVRSYKEENEKLQEELQIYEVSVSKLKEERQLLAKELDTTNEELTAHRMQNEKLQEELHAWDISNSKLQAEFQQLMEELDTTKEELSRYKQQNEKLQEQLHVQELSISKPTEPTAVDTTQDEVSSYRQKNEKLQKMLQVQDMSISKLEEELQQLIRKENSTKDELSSYRQQNEKLQEELHVRDVSVSKLKEELQRLQTALMKTADTGLVSPSVSLHPQSSASSSSTTQPKRKTSKQPATKGSSAKDKPSLSKKNSSSSSQSSYKSHSSRQNSSSEQQHLVVTDSFTQTEPLQMSDLSLDGTSITKEEMNEVIGDFQEKIVQMQELHAAEILDMEARHISESENLRRDTHALEDECKALKAVIDKLRSSEAPVSRQDRPISLFRDGYTSDSSSDYSQRTGYELPSLQQEFRTTPEGARRETDDPMPDRIKMLLREVHQEGMQVLSLSELPLSEGMSSNQFNVQGWMKERDALLDTVESLKGLITQMKTNIETQTSEGVDWRSQLLDAVRQVFLKERSVLKNTLYSQLDLLDTSDAIIHLNQLERRLAEQDAQHRDAMSSLHTAERSSLISEIHQLRGQLEQLHHGDQSTMALAADCSRREQRDGGGGETDRLLVEELKCELSQTKLELETSLKSQHKHLKELDTLRAEVSQKAAEVEALSDQLTDERKKSRDLQWVMEKEKCRSGRTEESKQEELEDLQISLEEQKTRVAQLTLTLEQEREASSQLAQQSEQECLMLQRNLQELQVQLETERAKAQEISSALGRERELRTGASFDNSSSNEPTAEKERMEAEEDGSLLDRLQKELDDKHAQVVHLLSQVEAQKLEVVRKEGELNLVNPRWKRDQEALLEAQDQLQELGAQLSETQKQLEMEMKRRRSVEEEKERLEERLARVAELRGQTQPSPGQRDSTDRTTDWVYQHKYGDLQSPISSISPTLTTSPAAHTSGQHSGPWSTVDKIVNKLHLISSKIHHMSTQSPGRATAEVDKEELSWVLSHMEEVIRMLQQFPALPSMPESLPLVAAASSSSCNSLAERLLRQNAELTGFVSRLTEEKNDLRNQVLRLEEELRHSRKSVLGSGDSSYSRRALSKVDSNTLLLSHERESWAREKSSLEKALQVAQSQVARLRAEIRSDTLREITGPEGDNTALKRMYGRYLRSESFRKALIYQKKYLLLLLGGFQECEEATLSLLSRMGGRPSLSSLDSYSQRRGGLMRFRSAVRVSIALSRMRYLVRRWHKATGMISSPSYSLSKNGTTHTLGTDMRDSPYLHPGSVEMYREKSGERGGGGGGVSSSRGRSGRESPRSAVSSTHHRFHMAGDHGPLTCSHLQSYDPDRALTDYISRLEALQRRLGSVTSGASSYTHLHYGLRR